MTDISESTTTMPAPKQRRRSKPRWQKTLIWVLSSVLLLSVGVAWLGIKANTVKTELETASRLIDPLKSEISDDKPDEAAETVSELRSHTAAAKAAVGDPLWTLASGIPVIGSNFGAIAEVARSSDDVVGLGLVPLLSVYSSLDWYALVPKTAGTDLEPMSRAAPNISSAAYAVRTSAERLKNIDTTNLLPQVSDPLIKVRDQLASATNALDAAADAATVLPNMLGANETRNYLLMIQNNAETRSSGGIPGALAVLTLEKGKLSLTSQSSATELGALTPPLTVDSDQQRIYTARLGKYMQDVNLTPDFPTAASSAQGIWEKKTGQRVDGVISIDPIALSYVLEATGPVQISDPALLALTNGALPTELNSGNLVDTLLADVYSEIEAPRAQDAYFAGVAQEVFSALSDSASSAKGLISGLTRGSDEGRVLVWSALAKEQLILTRYPLSGSISGPSVSPAQFGVYFNDGTGAKMDYHVKRTVQLIKHCAKDGYEQTTVRVTSSNNAPADAARSLPAYVTGDGNFGVPPGSVQTNVVAYGPVQSNVETARLDGQKIEFAPHLHSNRPVGVLAIQLAPGETKAVEFTFGKIAQHTEPNVVVTPTVQPVKDVTLATETAACG